MFGKQIGIHMIDLQGLTLLSEAYRKGTFRHSIAGQEGTFIEPAGSKPVSKMPEEFRANHLRAHAGNPP